MVQGESLGLVLSTSFTPWLNMIFHFFFLQLSCPCRQWTLTDEKTLRVTVSCKFLAAHGAGKNRFHLLVSLTLLVSACLLERKGGSDAYNVKPPLLPTLHHKEKGKTLKFGQPPFLNVVFWTDAKDECWRSSLDPVPPPPKPWSRLRYQKALGPHHSILLATVFPLQSEV